ncbi:YaiI/YqxD family protein [Legionella dresdenensis]|uniref:UPF0178 protein ACFORL_07910 n=1 Tax=Legionella dresdenensis TaxID=450200 RepID=A0ABV8CFX2_9GAMM
MQIWIDGDACPKIIKEMLFRAAIRTQTCLIAVSNHPISIPPSPFIKRYQVGAGFDVADKYILTAMRSGDLVITADIPLADAVITQGGHALNPRGELYSAHNIKQHLAIRNLNDSLRSCNMIAGGPNKISQKEVRDFANKLDKFLGSALQPNLD